MQEYTLARNIVLKHGWNTTCFQIVNPGLKYYFKNDAVIGYVDTTKVRVVAGAPVCSLHRLAEVAGEFEDEAKKLRQTVCYFGAEARLEALYQSSDKHSRIQLGAQPVWTPAKFAEICLSNSTLRAQRNRAKNKGVSIREISPAQAMEDIRLRECLTQWLEIKGLPALHFVIEPETLERLEFRRIFIAERGDDVVAFLILSPIPARNGWLTEQFPHKPNAPNGTVELMLSEAAGKLADDGAQYLTLGLSPLSVRANTEVFRNPLWLQALLFWMRKHGQRFYNFDGLDFFKAKFLPQYWEPVYAITNERVFTGRALWAIAKAFTANQPVRVISKGLFKAVVAEMRNFRNFLRSHIMKK